MGEQRLEVKTLGEWMNDLIKYYKVGKHTEQRVLENPKLVRLEDHQKTLELARKIVDDLIELMKRPQTTKTKIKGKVYALKGVLD